MTGNQSGRRFFSMIMDDRSFDSLFSKKHLIFILLDKKERKLLEKLLKISPSLIDQLDEDGNDPLLYICLKVYGCRHRIIELLIKMGCDIERRNFKGQHFLEVLQLQRNKKLFQTLTEHEIIKTETHYLGNI
jgi:ankyrin repeat protein